MGPGSHLLSDPTFSCALLLREDIKLTPSSGSWDFSSWHWLVFHLIFTCLAFLLLLRVCSKRISEKTSLTTTVQVRMLMPSILESCFVQRWKVMWFKHRGFQKEKLLENCPIITCTPNSMAAVPSFSYSILICPVPSGLPIYCIAVWQPTNLRILTKNSC